MSTISNDTLLNQLKWRYATKKFDPARKIDPETWHALEQSLILSPSSYGLQPWKFFIVENPETRKQLLPFSWNQNQIVDASHLVVFAVKKDVGVADAERLVNRTTHVRGMAAGSLDGFLKMLTGSLSRHTPDRVHAWMTNQIYIALGQFLASCALLGVDACPMEGFQPEKYDEVLGLPAKGYHAIVLATAGYRAGDDAYANHKKVRYPHEELIERI
ncbi:MAG: NAD(P)H-dependent oxidoreductase [Gemmataceae bacterium]